MPHRICTTLLLMALGSLSGGALLAESAMPRGILVLDDCDKKYEGKDKYEDHLTFVSAAGTQGFRVTGINVCESVGSHHLIAADSQRRCVWVSENVGGCIKRYDLDGKVTATIAAKGCGAIAVHPESGHVWAIVSETGDFTKSRTVVFDEKGTEIMTYAASGVDIVFSGRENAFWVVGRQLYKIFATDSFVDLSQHVTAWCGVSVDVDPQSGAVWIAAREHPNVEGSKNQLLKFDREGRQLAAVSTGVLGPFCLSVNPQDGSVWMVNFRRSLEHFSPEGKTLLQCPVPALAVQADRSGGVWAVTAKEILKLSAKGETLAKTPLAGETSQAWLGILE
ncbi:hypothetical protein [Prosthecobacter sp.]|uniref:hypothetical protein n=1 Tax=Prosthecobacter sp. TaxID=1965333 RepID=UPI00378494CF